MSTDIINSNKEPTKVEDSKPTTSRPSDDSKTSLI